MVAILGICRPAALTGWILLAAAKSLAQPPAATTPLGFSDRAREFQPADYLHRVKKAALVAMEKYWDPQRGFYVSPVQESSLTNIMMVQAFSVLAGLGELDEEHRQRCAELIDRLVSRPVCSEGGGVSLYMSRFAEPHISVSGPYCTALYYAWKYRAELRLDDRLAEAIRQRVTQQARWLMSELFNNRTGTNQTALRWAPEAAAAAYRITADPLYPEIGRQCRDVFCANYATVRPGYRRPWLNPDWTWIYDPTFPRSHSQKRDEYDFGYLSHCSAGVFFWQTLKVSLEPAELAAVNAILARSLTNWTVAGYPNWISTQLDHRAFSTNYWVWCLFSLTAMTRWQGWDQNHQSISRAILDRAAELFDQMFLSDPHRLDDSFIANPYRVRLQKTLSLNRHSDLAVAMYAAYLGLAIEENVFEVPPAELPRLWGFEKETKNLYVSTPAYSLASGNEILRAYYEDRGDITLLYHGNGRLLSPAYVQAADPPAQWSFCVRSGQQTVYSEQTKPDRVTVRVDGHELDPPDYDLTMHDLRFGRIEKESTWLRPEFEVTVRLTCLPDRILRELRAVPLQSRPLECYCVLPSRENLGAIRIAARDGPIFDLPGTRPAGPDLVATDQQPGDRARSTTGQAPSQPAGPVPLESIDLKQLASVHFRYSNLPAATSSDTCADRRDSYGYTVVPLTMELADDYMGRIERFWPPEWEWDRGRGQCIILRLSDGQTSERAISFSHLILFAEPG